MADNSKQNEQAKNNRLLEELNEKIDKQLSFGNNLKLGVFRGLGIAIGTTIIAAAVLTFANRFIDTVDDVPIIKDIIEESKIDDAIERS